MVSHHTLKDTHTHEHTHTDTHLYKCKTSHWLITDFWIFSLLMVGKEEEGDSICKVNHPENDNTKTPLMFMEWSYWSQSPHSPWHYPHMVLYLVSKPERVVGTKWREQIIQQQYYAQSYTEYMKVALQKVELFHIIMSQYFCLFWMQMWSYR